MTFPRTKHDPMKRLATLEEEVRRLKLRASDPPASSGGNTMVGIEQWKPSDQSFSAGTTAVVTFGGDVVTGGGTVSSSTKFYPGAEGWWQAYFFVEMTLALSGRVPIAAITCDDDIDPASRQVAQQFPLISAFGEFYGTCMVVMEPVWVEAAGVGTRYFYATVSDSATAPATASSAGTIWGNASFGTGARTRMGVFKVG